MFLLIRVFENEFVKQYAPSNKFAHRRTLFETRLHEPFKWQQSDLLVWEISLFVALLGYNNNIETIVIDTVEF